jgi:chromosome segregation protein
MMEQLDIRKAEVSQRILRLKSEEAILESDREKAQKQYDAVTNVIQSTNAECVRLDEEIHQIQEKLKKQNSQMEIGQTAYHREASRLESLRNITERYDGYGNSIRRVMEQKRRRH